MDKTSSNYLDWGSSQSTIGSESGSQSDDDGWFEKGIPAHNNSNNNNNNNSSSSSSSRRSRQRNILTYTVAHGATIIPDITSLAELIAYLQRQNGTDHLNYLSKIYDLTIAPVGNVCVIHTPPNANFSRIQQALRFRDSVISSTSNNEFVLDDRRRFTSRIHDIAQEDAGKTFNDLITLIETHNTHNPDAFPVQTLLSPSTPHVNKLTSLIELSGQSSSELLDIFNANNRDVRVGSDNFSGIFIYILQSLDATFYFKDGFFNIADEEELINIFEKMDPPIILSNSAGKLITGIDLAHAFSDFILYWNERQDVIAEPRLNVEYITKSYIPKGFTKPKPKLMLTNLNSMCMYILVNIVFDFLLTKTANPDDVYEITDFDTYLQELNSKDSKCFNVTTACRSLDTTSGMKLSRELINDISEYIRLTTPTNTQNELEYDIEEEEQNIRKRNHEQSELRRLGVTSAELEGLLEGFDDGGKLTLDDLATNVSKPLLRKATQEDLRSHMAKLRVPLPIQAPSVEESRQFNEPKRKRESPNELKKTGKLKYGGKRRTKKNKKSKKSKKANKAKKAKKSNKSKKSKK